MTREVQYQIGGFAGFTTIEVGEDEPLDDAAVIARAKLKVRQHLERLLAPQKPPTDEGTWLLTR